MEKSTKKALILSGVVIGSAIGLLAVASDYYVNMSIRRNKKKYSNKKRQQQSLKNKNQTMLKSMWETHAQMVKDSESWRNDVPFEHVEITSYDGLKLYGELFRKENSKKYVIIVHGYNCTHSDVYCYGPEFYNNGYNVLFIDMRAHGKSEGEYIGMGWLERLDLKKWCEFLVERDPDAKIALYGLSMGAASVLMATGEELPDNVKACIEDSGYTSVEEIYKTIMKEAYHIPSWPLLNTANIASKIKAGYSFADADSRKQIIKSKTPTLFIHAEGDSFVPFNNVETLYNIAHEPKELYTVPDAEHVCAAFYNKDIYFSRVFDFLDKYM